VLELTDVHVRYGNIRALQGVSLRVDTGELIALIGANGAGKTTTLRAISGLLRPSQGAITFDGTDLTSASTDRIVGLGVSHCPEGRRIFGSLTVAENLRLGAVSVSDAASAEAELENVFTLFPLLKERLGQAGGTLSGGEQQMLAIGRILRTGARFLMLDEPTEGLAPVIIQQIGHTIKRLKNEGFTILLVEQNFRFAATVADRYYIVEHGRIIDGFANAELQSNMDKLHTYLGV